MSFCPGKLQYLMGGTWVRLRAGGGAQQTIGSNGSDDANAHTRRQTPDFEQRAPTQIDDEEMAVGS